MKLTLQEKIQSAAQDYADNRSNSETSDERRNELRIAFEWVAEFVLNLADEEYESHNTNHKHEWITGSDSAVCKLCGAHSKMFGN